MGLRIAINGFGRIGRYLVRILAEGDPEAEIVAINSRADSATLAHLLKYDSVHGRFPFLVEPKPDQLIINGKPVQVTRQTDDPCRLPWKDLGIDIVLESTGKLRDRESSSKHLEAGSKKVIIAAPGKNVDVTLVMGVNEKIYNPQTHHIISNASCTTNCLAPVVKVLHENFGIQKGLMTTIHSYTMDQRILDGSHKDLRRGRAAALSMIPTTTGAARAVTQVLPELKGKLDGLSIRVPTCNVSLVDFVAHVAQKTSIEAVNQALIQAAEGPLKNILYCTTEELVSIDYTSSTYSSIVDLPLTMVSGGDLVKVFSWYDNESGFANRMIDLAKYIGKSLKKVI